MTQLLIQKCCKELLFHVANNPMAGHLRLDKLSNGLFLLGRQFKNDTVQKCCAACHKCQLVN